jgi:hypothetical protein
VAFLFSPPALRTFLRAGLAVALPVLLTGCGENFGGQSTGAGPALFTVPPSPTSSPPLVSSLDVLSNGGSFNGRGTADGSALGGSSRQRISGLRTLPTNLPPSSPSAAARQTRPTDSVPGPLPVLGAAAAFGFSRRLRRRIRSGS